VGVRGEVGGSGGRRGWGRKVRERGVRREGGGGIGEENRGVDGRGKRRLKKKGD